MPREHVSLNTAIADYYRVRRGRYAHNTWRSHTGQLEKWRDWVTRETQPNVPLALVADPDERYMERYFARLRPPALSPSTYNIYRQHLRSFWRYCIAEGWASVDPMRHVDPMRPRRTPRLQLSAHELARMLEDATEPRDRIALALGINTALRAGDITALTVGDVNLTNGGLHAWVEKTDEHLELGITAELRRELMLWYPAYAAGTGLDDWRDLPNHWHLIPPRHYYPTNVGVPEAGGRVVYLPHKRITHPERIVQNALAKMGHPTRGEGFHTLRRSAARMVHDLAAHHGDADAIRYAQALLGHKSQLTTEIYLGLERDRLRLDGMMRGRSLLNEAIQREAEVSNGGESSGGNGGSSSTDPQAGGVHVA